MHFFPVWAREDARRAARRREAAERIQMADEEVRVSCASCGSCLISNSCIHGGWCARVQGVMREYLSHLEEWLAAQAVEEKARMAALSHFQRRKEEEARAAAAADKFTVVLPRRRNRGKKPRPSESSIEEDMCRIPHFWVPPWLLSPVVDSPAKQPCFHLSFLFSREGGGRGGGGVATFCVDFETLKERSHRCSPCPQVALVVIFAAPYQVIGHLRTGPLLLDQCAVRVSLHRSSFCCSFSLASTFVMTCTSAPSPVPN